TLDPGGFAFGTSQVYRTSGTDERTAPLGPLPAGNVIDMPGRSLARSRPDARAYCVTNWMSSMRISTLQPSCDPPSGSSGGAEFACHWMPTSCLAIGAFDGFCVKLAKGMVITMGVAGGAGNMVAAGKA